MTHRYMKFPSVTTIDISCRFVEEKLIDELLEQPLKKFASIFGSKQQGFILIEYTNGAYKVLKKHNGFWFELNA